MKTKNIIAIILLSLFALSCGKDSGTPDLTKELVGVFKGTLTVTGVGNIPNVQLRVTKLDNEAVFIQPFAGNEASSFESFLTDDPEGLILTIPDQVVTGGSIRGNIGIIPGFPGANGFYENATKAFAYAIKVNIDGTDYDEVFQGVKQ